MQNKIAQHQQRREKVTWYPHLHCAQFEQDSTLKRRRPEPSRTRAISSRNGTSAYPKKRNVSCESSHSHSTCICDVAIPMRSANNDLQNTIRFARHYWRTKTLRTALVSTLLDPTLLNLYPYSTLPLPLPLPLPLLYLYSALLFSTLRYLTLLLLFSLLLFSTLLCYTLPFSSLLYSTLPLLCLYSTLPPLYFTQVPAGHNDLWASENMTS